MSPDSVVDPLCHVERRPPTRHIRHPTARPSRLGYHRSIVLAGAGNYLVAHHRGAWRHSPVLRADFPGLVRALISPNHDKDLADAVNNRVSIGSAVIVGCVFAGQILDTADCSFSRSYRIARDLASPGQSQVAHFGHGHQRGYCAADVG